MSALVLGGIGKALADQCDETPAQTEGPFYPGKGKFVHNHDLTMAGTLGQVVYVRGHVIGMNAQGICAPLEGARVEIWQACDSGKYNHGRDPNPAPLDPNFKYWGETFTDTNGEYLFKTIVPGAYQADTDWKRPPHIHYKVAKLGYHELTTQMYWKGNPLNDKDLILLNTPESERGDLLVDFVAVNPEQVGKGFDPKAKIGTFNLTLKSVRL